METEISRFKETAEALNEIDAALNGMQMSDVFGGHKCKEKRS